MSKFLLPLLIFLSGLIASSGLLTAQTDYLRVTVANLSQDLSLLSQQVKTLRLEMEELRRENARLRVEVAAAALEAQEQVSNLSISINSLRSDYVNADETQKEQIITEINRQVNALAKQTQSAIDAVARVVQSRPKNPTDEKSFSDDFPKTGKPYLVRSGDTLSNIALEHKSTIKWIQNANKIVDPSRDLKVGETIFIPIKQ
ncbi:MAG: LysM peptidoglycan-binding domain-containing protein [Verrucomicrobiota bacterium]|nr:LysM peptidoglycan-binding domain-containing protein [Verrucomicrobiota bacterium]